MIRNLKKKIGIFSLFWTILIRMPVQNDYFSRMITGSAGCRSGYKNMLALIFDNEKLMPPYLKKLYLDMVKKYN